MLYVDNLVADLRVTLYYFYYGIYVSNLNVDLDVTSYL
jgi:hypothetical protein